MCTYCGCFLKTKTSEIQTVRSHHEPQSISTLRLQFTMHFAVPCYDAKVVLFSFVSVGVKPCETNGKAKRKKHQRCSWQLNCLQEKKNYYKTNSEKGNNTNQDQTCFQIISRGCTCFWPLCSHGVWMFFGCSQRIIMNPSPLAIEALGKMPTVHLPAHHSEQDFFEPSLTQKPFRPVFHSKLAFGLGLFQPKTLLSSLFSWFPANVRIKFHSFPLSGTDSRLKVQLTPS